jgi:UDP:flavonoid glycosyltransferase YjiC (YdhE family)
MKYQAEALRILLSDNRFDAVIADAIFLGYLPMLLSGAPDRPSVLTYSTTPLFLSSCDTAPGGTGIAPATGVVGRARNRLLNVVGRRVLLAPAQRAADAALAELGLPPLPTFVLDSAVLADRFISPTIEEFEYPRSDKPDHVRFVGAVNPTPTTDFTAPDWWHELDGSRPVVHVTQGTIDNADLGKLVEPTIEALADEDVTLVVTTGGRDVAQLAVPLPANTHVAEYLPHDVLLPKVDVMVTNGGYGAVQRALSTGVPLVVAGNTEDKPEVAARVQWAGVGVNLRTGTPTASAVRTAVRQALSDGYRTKAQVLQQKYAARDSIAEIAALVDEAIAARRPAATR